MNYLFKLVLFVASATVVAAFALSSGAAFGASEKTYYMTIEPSTGTSPVPTMTATLTNLGVSSFNSFTVTLPTGYRIVGTPSISSTKGTASYANGVVTVLNIGLPIGSGANQVITVTMTNVAATSPANGACGSTNTVGEWRALVYSGSSLTGAKFSPSGKYPVPTTISPLCYAVSGTVSGLNSGNSVTLQNNGANGRTVTYPDNTFSFGLIPSDTSYSVSVSTQPTGQTCVVSNGTGTVTTANITNVSVTCTTNTYTVGGLMTGLGSGKSVTLQNNLGDDLTISGPSALAGTAFTFATKVAYGGAYSVTVKTQPVGQTCSVGNPSGTMGAGNVTSVSVSCTTNTYTVGGSMTGLGSGKSVTLQNNLGDDLIVSGPSALAGTAFTFATKVAYGGAYSVTVKTQPVGQTCSVGSPSGTVLGTVTTVSVVCSTDTYTVGGSMTGLDSGKSVTLQNNLGDDLTISGPSATAGTAFTFATKVAYGGAYSVTVKIQPIGQTCSVGSPSGTVLGTVTTVSVSCTLSTYTVGGTMTGLGSGKSVTLQNNLGDDLIVSGPSAAAGTAFTFATQVAYGGGYSVTVKTQPVAQTCSVGSPSGTVLGTVITVSVSCISNTLTITVPGTAYLNTPFNVTVNSTPPGPAVTLTSSDCYLSLVPGATTTNPAAFEVTITGFFASNSSNTCTITADAGLGYATDTKTISPVITTDGVLGCGEPAGNNKGGPFGQFIDASPGPNLVYGYLGQPNWGLVRAKTNYNGAACKYTVPYDFLFYPNISGSTTPYNGKNRAEFLIPLNYRGEQVAAEYVLLFKPIPVTNIPAPVGPGLPYPNVQLGWLKNGTGEWIMIPGLACLEDNVEAGLVQPANWGITNPGETWLPVMPTLPGMDPFNNGSQPVGYRTGDTAKMCIAQQGWTMIGRSTLEDPALIQFWFKVIDYADGAMQMSD